MGLRDVLLMVFHKFQFPEETNYKLEKKASKLKKTVKYGFFALAIVYILYVVYVNV